MEGYKAVIERGSRDFTARERLKMKEFSDAIRIVDFVQTENPVITVVDWAVVHVTNANAKRDTDKEYIKFLIIDKDGIKYTTGSQSIIDSVIDFWTELDGEELTIKFVSRPSKNYDGNFITAVIV